MLLIQEPSYNLGSRKDTGEDLERRLSSEGRGFILHLSCGSSIKPVPFSACPTGVSLLGANSGSVLTSFMPYIPYISNERGLQLSQSSALCAGEENKSLDWQNQPYKHSESCLVSRLPNHFKDTRNHEAQAKQEETHDHRGSSYHSFLLNQD